MQLVLSIFPGLDLFGRAFEEAGMCVVRGPDYIMGQDIRGWWPPSGRFDGVIGGPPCQSFSALATLVRHKGYEPKFGNLIPEFERVVLHAHPYWWLCENVEGAPVPAVPGYTSGSLVLSPRDLGDPQSRRRRFTFGCDRVFRTDADLYPLLKGLVALEPLRREPAVTRDCRETPVARGGSGKPKTLSAKNRRRTFTEMCAIQGYPELAEHDAFVGKRPTWTKEGARQAIGNGVPRVMGVALARAIKEWLGEEDAA